MLPRRDLWRSLPIDNFRELVGDTFDQNDRDKVSLAAEVRKVNTLLTANLVAFSMFAIMAALNLAFRVV
jgi:hypothetical protein